MKLIDENGDLFGVVNVVDALVVLLVLAVVVAGAALVFRPAPEPTEPNTATRYATLDLGAQPDYVSELISPGDSVSPNQNFELTVTDVYATDDGDKEHVLVRVKLVGRADGETIEYAGAPLRIGRSLTITTPRYEVSGHLRAVDESNPRLDLVDRRVLLSTTLDVNEADDLRTGTTVRRANETVATVEDVVLYPTDDPNQRRAVVLATLRAHRTRDGAVYGTTPLKAGNTVAFATPNLSLRGDVLRVGAPSLPVSDTDVLLRTTLSAETASSIHVGDTFDVNGHTVGTVDSVTAYGTGSPDTYLAYVGVTYRTYRPRTQPRFAGRVVQEGATLPFHTDAYDFAGRVVRTNAVHQRGRETTRTVTLELRNVDPGLAESLHAGMRERVRGNTVATIDSVSVEPAKMVLTSQDGHVYLRDNPLKRTVTMRATLQVRDATTGVRFKGQQLRRGETVTLDLGTVTVRATVTSV